jgi:hypothetical protein
MVEICEVDCLGSNVHGWMILAGDGVPAGTKKFGFSLAQPQPFHQGWHFELVDKTKHIS